MEVRVRIAPSPTGIPHIGNTRTALYNFLFAKKNKGKFILRIEDTDKERLVPESLEKILEILRFLNLSWDEGPFVQSQRLSIYQKHAEDLVGKKSAYYCFCTKERLVRLREVQKKRGDLPKYDRFCLKLTPAEIQTKLHKKEPYVIRLLVPDKKKIGWEDLIQGKVEIDSSILDDQVLLKSDGYPTYHLGVVVDDYLMKISHVLRGVEWLSSTPKHILLYEKLGWPLPVFGHMPIILGPDKAKLSKRHGAKSALDYRDEGYLPEAIINFMVFLGWSYKDNSDLLTLEELVNIFEINKVRRSNPVFDIKKLDWFNAGWIKKLSDHELAVRIKPFIKFDITDSLLVKIIPLIKQRITRLTQAGELIEFFVKIPDINVDLFSEQGQDNSELITQFKEELKIFEKIKPWSTENIQTFLNKLALDNNWQKGRFFMSLRLAITGKKITPPLMESMEILGKTEVAGRVEKAINKINVSLLRTRLKKRHQSILKDFESKQVSATKWLISKNINLLDIYHASTRLLTTGTLAGTMLLTSNIQPPLAINPGQVQNQGLRAQLTNDELHRQLASALISLLPGNIGKVEGEQEKNICDTLHRFLGFPVCFRLAGNELNYFYAWTGYEQHLYRFPGDTLDRHQDDLDAGIAPGLGAWGYFAQSKESMTSDDYLKEKYYVAVQTLYLPEWNIDSERIYNWYKYRKVIMVNPENGTACVAVVGDAGPADWTGKQFGGSPELMRVLGLNGGWQKGKVLLLFVDDPDNKIPLGPVEGMQNQQNA